MSTFAGNAVAILAARVLPPAFGFALNIAIARLLGSQGMGGYAALVAAVAMFQALAGAGMQFFLAREIAGAPGLAPLHLVRARSFAMVSGTAATALCLLYAAVILPDDLRWAGVLLALTLLPSALMTVQESVFIGLKAHHFVAVVSVLENSVKLLIGLAALTAGGGVIALSAAIAIGRMVGLVIGARCMRHFDLGDAWIVDSEAVAPFARAILPFAGLYVLAMVYFRVDVPIMMYVAGASAAGHYGVAVALYSAAMLLPDAALAAAYPRLAAAFKASQRGYLEATWLLLRLLVVGMSVVSLAVMGLAGPVVLLLFGSAFAPSAELLRWLSLSLPVHAMNGVLGQAMQAGGVQRQMLAVEVAAVAAHVALNIALVASFGTTGAPMALLASGIATVMLTLGVLHARVGPIRLSGRMVGGVITIAVPLLAVVAAPMPHRLPSAILGMVFLLATARRFGALDPLDWLRVRQALRGSPDTVER